MGTLATVVMQEQPARENSPVLTSSTSAFWQAKIWGLLHDPLMKSLYKDKSDKNKTQQKIWEEVLQELGNSNPADLKQQIKEADFIAAASDRPAWDQDNERGHVDYTHAKGLHVSHLLSGNPQFVVIDGRTNAHPGQDKELDGRAAVIIREQLFPLLKGLSEEEQHQKAFWWLWRCLPVAMAREFGENTALLPADTRIPDCSVWSHNSSVSSLAGTLVKQDDSDQSRPYLAIFSMTPVQEMIKASRKMQDFWAGSWLLHYLSAKVCWKWACKYGPDSLVYPSLYAQPLIDHWLLRQRWSDFDKWIDEPSPKQLLTAGFPNVLVAVLPKHVVSNRKGNALAIAENILREAWLELGNKVWQKLPRTEEVNQARVRLWDGWLKHQWQTHWTALPLGHTLPKPEGSNVLSRGQGKVLTGVKSNPNEIKQLSQIKKQFLTWANAQNEFCQLSKISDQAIDPSTLIWNPSAFHDQTCPTLAELSTYKQFNVGLWWAKVFDQLRHNLAGVKNARTWELPSVFGPRSTVSGVGAVLHLQQYDKGKPVDWVTESETHKFWQKERGWFDGREELNATEVLKRGLKRVLPELLGLKDKNLAAAYPDLTVGVAGLLHQLERREDNAAIEHYCNIGNEICTQFDWAQNAKDERWGIPWIDDSPQRRRFPHPRLLNDGWLIEDCPIEDKEALKKKQTELQKFIQSKFPAGANPTDWYVLAAGDGDDMGEWLKGVKLKAYKTYVPEGYPEPEARNKWEGVEAFLQGKKRMGPATHAALSRALLDFSNQLVPYLTEQRYAGRLIYSGGDDVLAYTNLWEWDSWLWDICQCFKGAEDREHQEFKNEGDYWQWNKGEMPKDSEGHPMLASRPLFTMGGKASISFGMVIAHHSVPLAIALENLWAAEKDGAKQHIAANGDKKDAVQIRVLYGNGNILTATSKFNVFNQWRSLLTAIPDLEPALFEQAAEVWQQHPIPMLEAISPWTQAFCLRREALSTDVEGKFQKALAEFFTTLWMMSIEEKRDREIQNWLKLAAFTLRNRDIKVGGEK